jgi:hypothetical protein
MAHIQEKKPTTVTEPILVPETKKPLNLKYQRDKDREKVKGIFRFHEVPGGSMSFVFKAYKEDQVERFDLIDGQVYTLPLGVAKHLNRNVWYPVHAHLQDESGNQSMKINQKVRRCSFQSLEFVDVDDLSPIGSPLVGVEFTNQGMSGF